MLHVSLVEHVQLLDDELVAEAELLDLLLWVSFSSVGDLVRATGSLTS